ncbi:E3 ubiquitin-protein ligase TRIM39-like [Siniperca chuatsi]|uniref:E3 ubiquitin-protein ligase TRIM39-like n=1 Tax=Siniperca chuatsi TaxID=119488 RepID=UPI001CE0FC7E|nr:E3 ubiquitin-protein ligase TRIM39-like [Siniperca chuatsi]
MSAAFSSEDLTCAICLTIFTDPVNLPCGHSFCRECITHVLSSQTQCPNCRTAVPTEATCLPTSHLLKSLAEKAKEAERMKRERGEEKAQVAELCPEHEEKLKLFCVTDQQLACIICRDGERHEGHKFKPIREAAVSLRQELERGMENLSDDILATESLANTQREVMTKTKEKSEQLKTHIHRQFEEMHQFLRKREDEIKNELKHKEEDAVEKMSESLNAIETALSESRELQGKVTSVLQTEDPERFLMSWTERNSTVTPEHLFRPRASDLKVVNTSLSLGPYESHLQFFLWKEMLQVIQPRAELLSLKSNSTDITVSDDGRSLFCSPKSNQAQSDYFSSYDQPKSFRQVKASKTFGSPAGFGQVRASNTFGSSAASGQTTASGFFGTTAGFGQVRASNTFGSSAASSQTTASNTFGNQSKNHAFSVSKFTSGQHYWEIEVGHRDYWELGIEDHFLKYEGQKYAACSRNIITELAFGDKPRKIGIYLNCSSKELSFYDADNMTHIHTMSSKLMSMPLSAYFTIRSRDQISDPNPLTACWY